ncbi:unnamed protein product [Protopolystoma xenopodis]|uniref:CSD1 domain-containing protein n=1 Tax=Protopolystoma xenopodis TaxID=117903 RepID=A0A448X5P2_9PLAT|nr:unnamed protein product [Protopolystoma xenopodis]
MSEPPLLAGLRSGQFVQGVLRVSRYRANQEASVCLTDASTVKHVPGLGELIGTRTEICIHGLQARNRAIDGDIVVVALLPKNQWSSTSGDISELESSKLRI